MLSCSKMLFKEGLTSLKLQEEEFNMKKEEMMVIKKAEEGKYFEEELMVIKEEEELMEIKDEEMMEIKDEDKMMMKREIKWGTMIPLVGGSALGCERAAGSLPQYHLSYSPFANNEAHLRSHWADKQVCKQFQCVLCNSQSWPDCLALFG